jgi:hypothetical protein
LGPVLPGVQLSSGGKKSFKKGKFHFIIDIQSLIMVGFSGLKGLFFIN